MITTAIITVVYFIVYGLCAITILLLPDVSASSDVVTGITSATQYLATWNNFLPLDTILSVMAAIIAVELIVAIYKIVMWVIRRFPTQS